MIQSIPPSSQLASVQVLRAVAALTVVFGHAQHDALVSAGKAGIAFARNHMLPWGAGVDLFFVISGFIMVFASVKLFGQPDAARIFMRRRLIRIVPLYWLMATVYFILAQSFGGAASTKSFAFTDIIAAYLFWPTDSFGDGHARPFYTLGWTLNYEMFFYVLFSAFLFLTRRNAILAITISLGLLVALVASLPTSQPLTFWGMPIVLEFVLGMLIAEAYLSGIRLSHLARLAMLTTAFLILLADPMGAATKPETWITPNDWSRLACWGLPAALAMAAIVLGRDQPGQKHGPSARFWVHLGDASYALYLTHPFIIVPMRKLWLMAGMEKLLGFWPLVFLTMLLAIALAFITHRLVELPLTRWLSQPSRPSAGKASSK